MIGNYLCIWLVSDGPLLSPFHVVNPVILGLKLEVPFFLDQHLQSKDSHIICLVIEWSGSVFCCMALPLFQCVLAWHAMYGRITMISKCIFLLHDMPRMVGYHDFNVYQRKQRRNHRFLWMIEELDQSIFKIVIFHVT